MQSHLKGGVEEINEVDTSCFYVMMDHPTQRRVQSSPCIRDQEKAVALLHELRGRKDDEDSMHQRYAWDAGQDQNASWPSPGPYR